MLVLLKKDFKIIFKNRENYLIICFLLLILGLLFFLNLDSYNYFVANQSNLKQDEILKLSLENRVLNYFWFTISIFSLFPSIFIAVKMIEIEKNSGMLKRILKLYGGFKFVLEKTIVVIIYNLLVLLIFSILIFVLSFLVKIYLPQLFSAFLGSLLSMVLYSMIALFVSLITTGIWIPSFITILIVLVNYFIYSFSQNFSTNIQDALQFNSILFHQQKFIMGALSIQSLMFFLFIISSLFVLSVYRIKKC